MVYADQDDGSSTAQSLQASQLNNGVPSPTDGQNGIDGTIVPGTAKLQGNEKINITKQGDTEYTISYPGVTEDTPLKYKEDFESNLSKILFFATVVKGTTVEKPHSLNIYNTEGGLDYSEVTEAADKHNGNIPTGSYTMTLDFSKIGSIVPIVNNWKTIGFEGGGQVITIHVQVGTEWGDNSVFDNYRIKTVNPDNVTFNLFDYWVDGETAHDHPDEGTNEDMLATCGIPNCIGETQKVIAKNDVKGSGYQNTGYYNKGINANHALVFSSAGNETGGWNFNTNNDKGKSYEKFQGGPYYGLVKNTLGEDGYPVLQLNQDEVDREDGLKGQKRSANESLAYLFNPNVKTDGREVYKGAKGLLKRDAATGNYKYSSLENFASYNEDTNSFDVYSSWAVQGGESLEGQFFPFNTANQVFQTDESGNPETDEDGNLVPSDVNSSNEAFLTHYFGLTMNVTFQQPVGGMISNTSKEKPMSFQFTGDDDVWIFIDGVLVADIGGIHDTETATIDFSTGKIKIDRTERFGMATEILSDKHKKSRVETTIREQFEKAGKLVAGEMSGDTFADNTVHVLTMFYMERGNHASNLELEFNLQEPQYSTLEKVDQDGNGLEGVVFDLYKADESWQPKGDKIATLTTGEDGSVNLTKKGEDGVERVIVFENKQKYILREVKTLPGYVTQGDIHLIYDAGTATLSVENKWETGAVGGFKAQVTMTDTLMNWAGEDITSDARDGLIIAVPMYNPVDKGDEATKDWMPVYGSPLDGYKSVMVEDSQNDEDYRRAVLEAAFRQFANQDYEDWHLSWNDKIDRFEGTLEDLPASVNDYVFVDNENGRMATAYYLLTPSDGLFDKCTTDDEKCEKIEELMRSGDVNELVDKYQADMTLLNMSNFNRQFYSCLHIPNKVRYLHVLKENEKGEPLAGAVFTLYGDEECKNPVAAGVTDENGLISFSAQNDGNNAIVNPVGGLSSEVNYALAQNRDEATGGLTEKKLWLKETAAPEGYVVNPTVTRVLISNDYLYVDAGTTDDGVRVARGLGQLVQTMARYASDGDIDVTLRDVLATGYRYEGSFDKQGFPDVRQGKWSEDKKSGNLELHYGLDTALLDYGLHKSDDEPAKVPVFVTDAGWYSIGVKQNRAAHDNTDPDDPYYKPYAVDTDLNDTNISALFTGSTTIVYQDKKKSPDPDPKTGDLTVSKTVSGSAGDKDKDWSFTVTLSDESIDGAYGEMEFEDGVAKFTLKHGESRVATGLPVGVAYEVTEAEADKDGYATTSTGGSGTITEGGASAAFVNSKDGTVPGPKTGNLTVSKTVAGNAGDKTKDWTFTVALSDKTIDGVYGEMEFTDGVATFTLKHGGSKTAVGLPVGVTYKVVEAEANMDGYVTASTGEEGKIAEGTSVVAFQNAKNTEGPDPEKPEDPDKPEDPGKPEDPERPGKPGKPTDSDKDVPKLPGTGDASVLAAGTAAVAGIGAIGAGSYLEIRRKKK